MLISVTPTAIEWLTPKVCALRDVCNPQNTNVTFLVMLLRQHGVGASIILTDNFVTGAMVLPSFHRQCEYYAHIGIHWPNKEKDFALGVNIETNLQWWYFPGYRPA